MAAIYGVELIPNSSIDPYLTFLVGVLAGIDRRGLEPEYETVPARQATPAYGQTTPRLKAPPAAGAASWRCARRRP